MTATLRSLNEALAKERTRQWSEIKEPEISDDSEAARLQKAGLDLPRALRNGLRKNIAIASFSMRSQRRTKCNELDTASIMPSCPLSVRSSSLALERWASACL